MFYCNLLLLFKLSRRLLPSALVVGTAAMLSTTPARAVTVDDIVPATLVGKKLSFAVTPVGNTLESAVTAYSITFDSATTYTRRAAGHADLSGTYTSFATAVLNGTRTTSFIFDKFLFAGPSSQQVFLSVSSDVIGISVFAASTYPDTTAGIQGGTYALGDGGSTAGTGVTVSIGGTVLGGNTTGLGAGLLAYYKFDNTLDDVTGQYGAQWINGAHYSDARGVVGLAGWFKDAHQYVTTPLDAALRAAHEMTVSMWILTGPSASGYRLVDKQTAGAADGWVFDTYDISGAGRTVLRFASTTVGVNSTTTFPSGRWTNVAFTYQGGTVKFYIDGIAAGTGTERLPATLAALPVQLGGPRGSLAGKQYFVGSMDDVRIYSRALSSAEIALLAQGSEDTTGLGGALPVLGAPANLVGYRNKSGQSFQFTVTGAAQGAVWGTDVYTDDSSIAAAAVHAGVLRVGETKAVTISLLGDQPSFSGSTRNSITSGTWGRWPGSYAFAEAGTVTGNAAATAKPIAAPGFSAANWSLAVGGRLVLPVTVSGVGPYTYQWYLNGLAISGATFNPYTLDAVGAANAGTYAVDVANAAGTTRISAGTVAINLTGAPLISLQPLSKVVAPGGTFTLLVSASGLGNTYQWFRDGILLNGETQLGLVRQNVNARDAGVYTVTITNAGGSVTSRGATISLDPNASHLVNVSCRIHVNAGQIVIPGFVIQGVGTKKVLIRAVGPTLGTYGVAGVMTDPQLELYQSSTKIGQNDNWDAAAVGNAFAATGAFSLPVGSKDAALLATLTAGQAYTVQVRGVGNSTGVVLIEIYDADAPGTATSKLVNVSVRGGAAPGDNTLILGYVLGGSGQRTLLLRGGGPALAAFGVTGVLADPLLAVFDANNRRILENDNWTDAAFNNELVRAAKFVGAFDYTSGTADAGTLALLDPGAYSVQITGANEGSGEALAEVYDVP
jgi:hypothetical protein